MRRFSILLFDVDANRENQRASCERPAPILPADSQMIADASSTSQIHLQIQKQQVLREAEQAERKAEDLRNDAEKKRKEARDSTQEARSLDREAVQQQSNADTARMGLNTSESFSRAGEILDENVSRILRPQGGPEAQGESLPTATPQQPASTPSVNTLGQTTGTLFNEVA